MAGDDGADAAATFAASAKTVTKDLISAQRLLTTLARLIKSIGGPKDSERSRARITECLAQTKRYTDDLKERLGELEELARDRAAGRRERDQMRVRQKRLAKDYHSFVLELTNVAQQAQAKQREAKAAAAGRARKKGAGGGTGERRALLDGADDDEADEDEDGGPVQTMEYLNLENEVTFQHAVIHERRDVVLDIARDMSAVEEMFVDLAAIVADQESMIGAIEENAGDTASRTQLAYDELRKAADYQRRSRNKMCCMVLFLVLLAFVGVVMIMRFSTHRLRIT